MTRKFTVRIFFNILSLTCLIAGVGCNEFASNNDVLLNFVNESEGYELEYPVGWVAFELLDGLHGDNEISTTLSMAAQDFPNVYIAQKNFSSPKLEDILTWGESRALSSYGEPIDYELGEPEIFDSNDNLLARREYTVSYIDGKPIRKLDAYLVNDNTAYILTFSAIPSDFEKQTSIFEQMIASFHFINEE